MWYMFNNRISKFIFIFCCYKNIFICNSIIVVNCCFNGRWIFILFCELMCYFNNICCWCNCFKVVFVIICVCKFIFWINNYMFNFFICFCNIMDEVIICDNIFIYFCFEGYENNVGIIGISIYLVFIKCCNISIVINKKWNFNFFFNNWIYFLSISLI